MNPLHDSAIPLDQLKDVDAVIITHLHSDHFDDEAKEQLPKNMPVFVQNEADRKELLSAGISDVRILGEDFMLGSIQLIRTGGRHGYTQEKADALGEVCGVVLRSDSEITVYFTGDTVWCSEVAEAISTYDHALIIANAGANSVPGHQLIMGDEDVLKVHEAAPKADIVATHMESINH